MMGVTQLMTAAAVIAAVAAAVLVAVAVVVAAQVAGAARQTGSGTGLVGTEAQVSWDMACASCHTIQIRHVPSAAVYGREDVNSMAEVVFVKPLVHGPCVLWDASWRISSETSLLDLNLLTSWH
jgi:hypothetical protein